ncbi:MAG: site-specific DNA-methyltransferase [Atribacterota bacterium]|nr:site-specific DNA-methyltransferase [Atribacterota bacterium]
MKILSDTPKIEIYNDDCLNVLKTMPDKSVDLVLTDPPYNFESKGGGLYKKRGNLERIENSFGTDFLPEPLLNECERITKSMHGYFWCSKAIVRNYLNWAQDRNYGFNILTWHKSNPIPANNNNFLPDTEYCIFIRGKGTTFNQGLPFNNYTKYTITSVEKSDDHPTPKPIKLMEKYIRISSKEGDTILDPFMGSGTTGVACVNLNRNFIGIEISEKYCQISEERIMRVINQTKLNL